MHNFLIANNHKMEKTSEEVDDSAVHSYRKKVEKNIQQEKSKTGFPVMKAAGICAAVAVLAVGVLYLNDYQKLQSAREVLADIDQENQGTVQEETTPVNGNVTRENEEIDKENSASGESEQNTAEDDTISQEEETDQTQEESDQMQETETGEESSSQASVEIHPSYTIQQGDTITKISIKTYGSTEKVREICELNNLSVNDLIYPGQKILLP